MSVACFVEQLGSVGPDRMVALVQEGLVSRFNVLLGPAEGRPAADENRIHWFDSDRVSSTYIPRWGWWICSGEQDADAQAIEALDDELVPSGWVLDVEKASEGQPLEPLLARVAALGKPIVASIGGYQSSSHANLDFRALDRYGAIVDYQAYFDSGEGPTPAHAVAELYAASFVIPGWEYRHRLGTLYGWGRVTRVEASQQALYDSYKRPGHADGYFSVSPRTWGYTVVSRSLFRDGKDVGLLMGRAPYSRIAVTLDVTRTAQQRKPQEWTPIAASARVNGAARRPVSVYLLDICTDETLRAIVAGAA